jgi:hypothetical protein
MPAERPLPEALLQAPAPEVLLGGSSPEAPEALGTASSSTAPKSSDDQVQKREFLWKVHGYTNEYIRFADTKAGFCVGMASAVMAALFASKCHDLFLQAAPGQWTALAWASLSAFVLLALSIGASVTAVRPRLWVHSEKGFIFWQAVAEFDSPGALVMGYESQGVAELNVCLAHHLYSLAKVCSRKYMWVNVAILAAAVGGTLAVAVVLLKH